MHAASTLVQRPCLCVAWCGTAFTPTERTCFLWALIHPPPRNLHVVLFHQSGLEQVSQTLSFPRLRHCHEALCAGIESESASTLGHIPENTPSLLRKGFLPLCAVMHPDVWDGCQDSLLLYVGSLWGSPLKQVVVLVSAN